MCINITKILKWAVISTSMSKIPWLNFTLRGFYQRLKTNKTKKSIIHLSSYSNEGKHFTGNPSLLCRSFWSRGKQGHGSHFLGMSCKISFKRTRIGKTQKHTCYWILQILHQGLNQSDLLSQVVTVYFLTNFIKM